MNYRSLIGANASLLSELASQDASPPQQTINTYSNPSNIKRFDSLVNSIASAGAQFEVPNFPSHHRRNHRKIINPNGIKPRYHRNINGITDTDSNNDIFIDPSGVRPRYHRNINGITDTDSNNDIFIDPSGVRPRYHRNINGVTDTDSNNDIFIDPSGVRPRNFHRNINGITDADYYDEDSYSYSDDYEEPIVDPTIPDIPTPDPEPEVEPVTTPIPTPPLPVYRKQSTTIYTIVIIIIVILLLVLIFKIANEQKRLTRVISRVTNPMI